MTKNFATITLKGDLETVEITLDITGLVWQCVFFKIEEKIIQHLGLRLHSIYFYDVEDKS